MFSSKTLTLVSLLAPFTLAQNYGGGGSATTPTPAAAAVSSSSSATASTSATNTQTIMAAATGAFDLTFKPNSVVAAPGTFVEFHFGAANHSVAQSSLANPCSPANSSAIFAGFDFSIPTGNSTSVFTLQINDTTPFWFYCPQVSPAAHCPLGMAGVINPPSGTTGDQFVAAAKLTNGTIIPATVQGGVIGKAGAAPSGTSAAPSASPTSSATHLTVGMGLMGLVGIAFSALLSF